MDVGPIVQDAMQNAVGLLGLLGLALSIVALIVSLRSARVDRINVNNWERYRSYNSDSIRHGRALALQIKQDTGGLGLPTYGDYRAYFGLEQNNTLEVKGGAQPEERQYLHDLAAFYHQTGILLDQKLLDRNFTLLLIGPGLEDRWPILYPLAGYYEGTSLGMSSFPYGGMYLLYQACVKWEHKRFAKLRKRFSKARGLSYAAGSGVS